MPVQMRRTGLLWLIIAGLVFSLLIAGPAWAAPFIWGGGGDGFSWNDPDNWDDPPNVPGVGDTVRFNTDENVTLGADQQVDMITINAANVTFNGGGGFSLTTDTLAVITPTSITMSNAADQLIVNNTFTRATNAVTLNGPGIFNVHGDMSMTGNGALTLAGGTRLYRDGDQYLYLPAGASGAGTEIVLSNSALLTIYNAGALVEYQGDISGAGSFRIQGGGDVTLSGSNSYTGSTSIAGACTFTATGAGNILPGVTDLTVTAPAVLAVDGQTVGSLSGTGTINISGALATNQAGTTTFSGSLIDAGGSFNMTGAGRINLTGIGSTADINQSSGTLVLNGSTTGGVNVTGGTFMGTGSADGLVNVSPGTFAPGNSIGTFRANGNLNIATPATLAIEVNGSASDQVDVTGFATVNNSTLTVTGGPTAGATFTIVNNDGADVIGGTFNSLAEGASFNSGGYQYEITYVGGDGNDIVLTALTGVGSGGGGGTEPEPEPEPSGPPAPSVTTGSGPSPIGSLEGPQLSWPQVDGADHYRIYRADCPGCKRTAVGWVAETSFVDATAIAGKPYYYWVRSENSDGMGPYSNWMVAWRYEQNPGRPGDFNGDGIMDLLWWNPESNQLSIWFMNNGSVQSVSASGEALNIAEWLLVATADLNGDGACDLLWWKPETGEIQAWYLDKVKAAAGGNGEWLVKNSAGLDSITSHAAIAYPGDVNGDGRIDILWRDHGGGQVTLWIMGDDGKPLLNGPPTPTDDSITRGDRPGLSGALNWQVAGLADADGDGKADVIWKDARNNHLAIWTMDAFNISAATLENKGLDVVWRSVGVGDLNADKQADIVWRHEASGAVQAWLMQAGVFVEERTMVQGSQEAANWQVKAVGDFCSPGCDDVYCKHSESELAKIFTLDGKEFSPTVE